MTRGQLDALGRHQIDEGVVVGLGRDHLVHGADHLLVLLRAGDGQHAGVYVADAVFGHTHAAGDDHLAVLGDGLTDGVQGFGLGAVDETAGVDHHDVGILVGRYDLVAFHAQLGEDAFGVYGRFRTSETDEPDFGRCGGHCG
ncbi:hypothetical protein D9M68_550370 [compost metagenome]